VGFIKHGRRYEGGVSVKFALGIVAGVFLTLTIYKGWPYVIRFDDLPETPVEWQPKMYTYQNGKRVQGDL